MERKLFSKKDGTTFIEDIRSIVDEFKSEWAADKVERILERLTQLEAWYNGSGQQVITVGEKIKEMLTSGSIAPILDFITAAIPTEFDDQFVDWLRAEGLQSALDAWLEVPSAIDGIEQRLSDLLNWLEGSSVAQREAATHKIPSLILEAWTARQGETIGRVAADTWVQLAYDITKSV